MSRHDVGDIDGQDVGDGDLRRIAMTYAAMFFRDATCEGFLGLLSLVSSAWMIEGCIEWQRSGIKALAVVAEATNEYFIEQGLVRQWVGVLRSKFLERHISCPARLPRSLRETA